MLSKHYIFITKTSKVCLAILGKFQVFSGIQGIFGYFWLF